MPSNIDEKLLVALSEDEKYGFKLFKRKFVKFVAGQAHFSRWPKTAAQEDFEGEIFHSFGCQSHIMDVCIRFLFGNQPRLNQRINA